jgi:uncharacterized protein YodC (DUF2158 family)
LTELCYATEYLLQIACGAQRAMTSNWFCEAVMILRPGNLVRHKSGGPIMMVDDLISREQFKDMFGFHDAAHECTWLENGVKKIGSFRALELQSVYADGTPRNYDDEAGTNFR